MSSLPTALIAGGAGFIGSNLCKTLLSTRKIICVDNLFTGKLKNIEPLLNHENFTYLQHDIIHPLIIDGPVDEIFHFACPASPQKYQADSVYTLKINFLGSLHLLELAKIKNAKILLSSTSEVYGEPLVSPQTEDYRGNVNMIGIRSCYDEGKRIAETLFMDFHRQFNVDIRIVRIFNTYGPNMDKDDGRVVTNFIKQMMSNDDITIYGSGSQSRSFCFIDDLVDGIIRLMNSTYHLPVNLGNTREISINQLVSILQSLIPTRSKIIHHPLPFDDPTNRQPDISLAKKILHWEPTVSLEDGLVKTIQFLTQL